MVDNPSLGTKRNRDQKNLSVYLSLKTKFCLKTYLIPNFSVAELVSNFEWIFFLVFNLGCGYNSLSIWSLIESNFKFGLESWSQFESVLVGLNTSLRSKIFSVSNSTGSYSEKRIKGHHQKGKWSISHSNSRSKLSSSYQMSSKHTGAYQNEST